MVALQSPVKINLSECQDACILFLFSIKTSLNISDNCSVKQPKEIPFFKIIDA